MDYKTQILQAKLWNDRYKWLIQAGKTIKRPSDEELNQMQKIAGCEANLWFQVIENNKNSHRTFYFKAFSEARIINGLLFLLLEEIKDKSISELHQFDVTGFFSSLGIAERLSSTRLNGLKKIESILHDL